jgi:hypothetical protein
MEDLFDKTQSRKILKPEDLVSRSTSELLQLKRFYGKKIELNERRDVLRKPKEWFLEHKKLYFALIIISLIVTTVSFYAVCNFNNTWYSIPLVVALSVLMILCMILENQRNEPYYRNLETINIMLKVKEESSKIKNETSDPKKVIEVFNTLKEMGESNFTTILKRLKEKRKPISEKTLRKILTDDLKTMVSFRHGRFDSGSRKQKNAKIYYINEEK